MVRPPAPQDALDVTPSTASEQRYQGWVEQWSLDLYRLAYRLCGRADVAEDLVQETFYHAWRSIHSLREEHRARAWLFQILRHRHAHYVRADTRRPNLSTPLEKIGDPADGERVDPLENMAVGESLQQALDALDERYRVPLLMVFVQGMTCREAAEDLGVPLGTVLSRIHRARQALKKTLGDPEGDQARGGHATTGPQLRLGGAG